MHASDCATHNAPALAPAPCNCQKSAKEALPVLRRLHLFVKALCDALNVDPKTTRIGVNKVVGESEVSLKKITLDEVLREAKAIIDANEPA